MIKQLLGIGLLGGVGYIGYKSWKTTQSIKESAKQLGNGVKDLFGKFNPGGMGDDEHAHIADAVEDRCWGPNATDDPAFVDKYCFNDDPLKLISPPNPPSDESGKRMYIGGGNHHEINKGVPSLTANYW